MTAGLVIYNDSGTIQIDDAYRNLLMQGSGTNGNPSMTGITCPLCALQCTDVSIAIGASSGSSITYGVLKEGTASHKWWTFDLSDTPAGNSGLQVYTADGKLTYDSLRKAMRVVDYKKFTDNSWVGQSYSYAAGKDYAVIIGRYGVRATRERLSSGIDGYEMQEITKLSGAKVVGNVVTLDWVTSRDTTYFDSNPNQYTVERPAMDMIVVNVTNY